MESIPSKDKPVVISAENYKNKSIFRNSFLNPKILGSITAVLLLVVGVGAGVYLTQRPNKTQTQANLTTTDISFRPPTTTTETGSQFNLDIFGNANGNQITSAKLAFRYDPETLELISITPKEFLPKVLLAPSISSGSAFVSLGTDGNAGISGSGILATLTFKAKSPTASTNISLDTAQTQINILGDAVNSLAPVQDAVVSINNGTALQSATTSHADSAKQALPSPSATVSLRSATPSAQAIASAIPDNSLFDFNSDSQINSIDLSVVYSAWGNKLDTQLKKKADLNGDGAVNGLDYALFLPQLKQ